jgi:hypothetical protein
MATTKEVFEKALGTGEYEYEDPIRYEDPVEDELINVLRRRYPHGHKGFIPMTLAEMKLHSKKNHDYSFGGPATGNFDRVSSIKKLYPGLDWTTPEATALDYMLKQLDSAMWFQAKGHEASVEGVDKRWEDISVYAKIIRLLIKEGKETSDV